MKNAGRIMPLPKGEYSSAVTYNLLDFVTYDGSSYICKKESTGNEPTKNSEYWQLLAEKGSSGGAVTGVKGNAESTYRQGNVNLTKDNIGLGNVANERQYSASNPQLSVDTATKAAQDGNGNNIVNTYATKTEMNAVKKSVSDGKTLVANAITAKGVTTAADAEFATMATNIGKIKTTPNLQQKSVSLNTGTPSAAITPDAGYDGLSQVTASVSLQEKTQTLLHGSAAVIPDSGKVLSKVTANGPANKGGVTVDASAVTQDSNYTYFGIPAAGYYDTNSKLRSANSNLDICSIISLNSNTGWKSIRYYCKLDKKMYYATTGAMQLINISSDELSIYGSNQYDIAITLKKDCWVCIWRKATAGSGNESPNFTRYAKNSVLNVEFGSDGTMLIIK